jgi:predicted RNA methylase
MTSASKALDQYFTPTKLAAELIAAVTIESPEIVADFAAGDGELLRAAIMRWPSVKCVATDIDNQVVSSLRSNHSDWKSSYCDFLNPENRNSNESLCSLFGILPLVILNPPFSSRRKALQWVEIKGIRARCTSALAFIVTAAEYLMPGGQLVAIVPYGLISNEKDRTVRGLLTLHYGLEVVKTYAKGGFTNCSPRTATIRLTSGTTKQINVRHKVASMLSNAGTIPINLSIHRGKVPNNAQLTKEGSNDTLPFIHTTNLKASSIQNLDRRADITFKSFTGPAVLFPRVGRPKVEKIVLMLDDADFILSECVFIIECLSQNDASLVFEAMIKNWEKLKDMYNGTCASYISINELVDYLSDCGFNVLKSGESVRNVSKDSVLAEKQLVIPNASLKNECMLISR